MRSTKATIVVHVVWATIWRRSLLPREFDSALLALLVDAARKVGCAIIAAGNADDHVHAVVRLCPATPLAELVKRMKGGSAHATNLRHRLPTILRWQEGYWAESLAPAEVSPLVKYVLAQRVHHDDSHPAEQWQLADP